MLTFVLIFSLFMFGCTDKDKKLDDLESEEKILQRRCNSLESFSKSLDESMRRRAMELEFEIDRFENRIRAIKTNPNVVDKKLINMSLVIGEKSQLMTNAIKSMREEISRLNQEVREALYH